jgi:lycopene cyclase domain-containing protein
MEQYYYLGLDLFTISFPLLRSFEPRIRFVDKWPGLFTGIAVMAAVFIAWDVLFTMHGFWGFNDRYLVGARILHLPVEEWLFFLVAPYACLFLYEVMRHFVPRDVLGPVARPFSMALVAVLLILGLLHLDKWYTSLTFLSTAAFLGYHVIRRTVWLGRFYLGYGISLIPFMLVNGILTGSGLEEPIVWYNNAENLGIRIGTIPVEDSIYLLLMLLMVTTFYERPLRRTHNGTITGGRGAVRP